MRLTSSLIIAILFLQFCTVSKLPVSSTEINVKDFPLTAEHLEICEGELISTFCLSDGKITEENQKRMKDGMPVGILSNRHFTLLLIDGRVLNILFRNNYNHHVIIRATGMMLDKGLSLTPFKIEYKENNEWRIFDLPFSGVLNLDE